MLQKVIVRLAPRKVYCQSQKKKSSLDVVMDTNFLMLSWIPMVLNSCYIEVKVKLGLHTSTSPLDDNTFVQ